MLWCQGAQNIELSKHKLKSALHYITMHARPTRTDGKTDGQTDERTSYSNNATVRSNQRIACYYEGYTKIYPFSIFYV